MTDRKAYQQYTLENKFGWQIDRPVFVKLPFKAYGRDYKPGMEFNWHVQPCRTEDYPKILDMVHNMFKTGKIHHDSTREAQQKVGDRLSEFNAKDLMTLIRLVNSEVKRRCTTDKEFQNKRIKQSKILEKQRGIVRTWLNRNHWIMDEYVEIRDNLLERINTRKPEDIPEEEPQIEDDFSEEDIQAEETKE